MTLHFDVSDVSSQKIPFGFFSEIFTLVSGVSSSLDIETALGGYFEVGSCWVIDPFRGTVELHCQHTADDRHALGSIGAKVMFPFGNDSNAELASIPGTCEALHSSLIIRAMFNRHGSAREFVNLMSDDV
eukprot:CAMPEP_0171293364 /NCGR_PEP_ID=MMETSP0816-20121228/1564_1 /TAXON_ID=420281 /ORGANISM="Proboscia inermis, Strain CCAP1064/1" /LENGTH=129 /DNA_ID=CAMNT_0011764115 /DNA_START=116 /DNA_END=505 /DNA_ORIENTATION=-